MIAVSSLLVIPVMHCYAQTYLHVSFASCWAKLGNEVVQAL